MTTPLRPSLVELRDDIGLVGAEIGVYTGHNAEAILAHLSIDKLYLIDPYAPYRDRTSRTGSFVQGIKKEAAEGWCATAHKRLDKYDQVIWIQKISDKAAKQIPDESLDFAYIDGNHEFEWVMQDLKNYYPKIRPGGLLAGHDYKKRRGASVIEAVDLFVEQNGLDLHIYYSDRGAPVDWSFRKP